MAGTGGMLYIVPNLVDSNYENAIPLSGNDMNEVIRIAKEQNWPGYFVSERLANKKLEKEGNQFNWHGLIKKGLD